MNVLDSLWTEGDSIFIPFKMACLGAKEVDMTKVFKNLSLIRWMVKNGGRLSIQM